MPTLQESILESAQEGDKFLMQQVPFTPESLSDVNFPANASCDAANSPSRPKNPHSSRNRKKFGNKSHLAIYGNTSFVREYCTSCHGFSLVVDGKLSCCDRETVFTPKKSKRMSLAESYRKKPSRKAQKELLEKFAYCCAYCERAFGSNFVAKNKLVILRLHWDHKVPYAYSQNNHDVNFLPSCHKCNGWKSSLIFREIDDVRVYVSAKWEALLKCENSDN